MKKINISVGTSQIKTRITWSFNPIQRVVKSKKIYSRKKLSKKILSKEVL